MFVRCYVGHADIHDNEVYNDLGEATVTCGYSGPDSETTVPLSAFMDAGLMKGAHANPRSSFYRIDLETLILPSQA